MRMDDMILVSIDDHMIEPPDMYRNHVPARWLDEVPKVVRNEAGVAEAGDKELSLVMLQAYNDWHIDEWCAAYPGRFIPLGIVPMWDIDLAVAEVRRIAKKGCRSISFLEAPHSQGWPSFLSGHWDP